MNFNKILFGSFHPFLKRCCSFVDSLYCLVESCNVDLAFKSLVNSRFHLVNVSLGFFKRIGNCIVSVSVCILLCGSDLLLKI